MWKQRLDRLLERSRQQRADLARALHWHLRGGRCHFERYAPAILRGHTWCFIVGCNNSGTSLLHRILDRSGRVSTLPADGQRYTTALPRATRRGHERVWSEHLEALRLTAADPKACVPRLLHDWLGELPLPIQPLIVDKNTANAVRVGWLAQVFENSHFIGIVRNGYAVAEGIRRKGRKDLARGARHWNTVNRLLMEDAGRVGRFLEVRYEDLVECQDPCAERVEGFLDLPAGSLREGFGREFQMVTVAGSGPSKLRNMNPDSLRRLTRSDLDRVYDNAHEMLDRFGYPTPDAIEAEREERRIATAPTAP